MRCMNCEYDNKPGAQFCGSCGASLIKTELYDTTERVMNEPHSEKQGKIRKAILIVLSVFALLNVLILPTVTCTFDGIFPDSMILHFFKNLSQYCKTGAPFLPIKYTLLIFIPSILMLIFEIYDNRLWFSICSGFGAFMLIYSPIDQYFIPFNIERIYDMFNFRTGIFAIGYWIALALFVISVLISLPKND